MDQDKRAKFPLLPIPQPFKLTARKNTTDGEPSLGNNYKLARHFNFVLFPSREGNQIRIQETLQSKKLM